MFLCNHFLWTWQGHNQPIFSAGTMILNFCCTIFVRQNDCDFVVVLVIETCSSKLFDWWAIARVFPHLVTGLEGSIPKECSFQKSQTCCYIEPSLNFLKVLNSGKLSTDSCVCILYLSNCRRQLFCWTQVQVT